jgi:hypothetical protein
MVSIFQKMLKYRGGRFTYHLHYRIVRGWVPLDDTHMMFVVVGHDRYWFVQILEQVDQHRDDLWDSPRATAGSCSNGWIVMPEQGGQNGRR